MFSDKIFTDIGINKETQQMDFTQNGYHLFPLVQVLQNEVSKYDILYLKPHRAVNLLSALNKSIILNHFHKTEKMEIQVTCKFNRYDESKCSEYLDMWNFTHPA